MKLKSNADDLTDELNELKLKIAKMNARRNAQINCSSLTRGMTRNYPTCSNESHFTPTYYPKSKLYTHEPLHRFPYLYPKYSSLEDLDKYHENAARKAVSFTDTADGYRKRKPSFNLLAKLKDFVFEQEKQLTDDLLTKIIRSDRMDTKLRSASSYPNLRSSRLPTLVGSSVSDGHFLGPVNKKDNFYKRYNTFARRILKPPQLTSARSSTYTSKPIFAHPETECLYREPYPSRSYHRYLTSSRLPRPLDYYYSNRVYPIDIPADVKSIMDCHQYPYDFPTYNMDPKSHYHYDPFESDTYLRCSLPSWKQYYYTQKLRSKSRKGNYLEHYDPNYDFFFDTASLDSTDELLLPDMEKRDDARQFIDKYRDAIYEDIIQNIRLKQQQPPFSTYSPQQNAQNKRQDASSLYSEKDGTSMESVYNRVENVSNLHTYAPATRDSPLAMEKGSTEAKIKYKPLNQTLNMAEKAQDFSKAYQSKYKPAVPFSDTYNGFKGERSEAEKLYGNKEDGYKSYLSEVKDFAPSNDTYLPRQDDSEIKRKETSKDFIQTKDTVDRKLSNSLPISESRFSKNNYSQSEKRETHIPQKSPDDKAPPQKYSNFPSKYEPETRDTNYNSFSYESQPASNIYSSINNRPSDKKYTTVTPKPIVPDTTSQSVLPEKHSKNTYKPESRDTNYDNYPNMSHPVSNNLADKELSKLDTNDDIKPINQMINSSPTPSRRNSSIKPPVSRRNSVRAPAAGTEKRALFQRKVSVDQFSRAENTPSSESYHMSEIDEHPTADKPYQRRTSQEYYQPKLDADSREDNLVSNIDSNIFRMDPNNSRQSNQKEHLTQAINPPSQYDRRLSNVADQSDLNFNEARRRSSGIRPVEYDTRSIINADTRASNADTDYIQKREEYEEDSYRNANFDQQPIYEQYEGNNTDNQYGNKNLYPQSVYHSNENTDPNKDYQYGNENLYTQPGYHEAMPNEITDRQNANNYETENGSNFDQYHNQQQQNQYYNEEYLNKAPLVDNLNTNMVDTEYYGPTDNQNYQPYQNANYIPNEDPSYNYGQTYDPNVDNRGHYVANTYDSQFPTSEYNVSESLDMVTDPLSQQTYNNSSEHPEQPESLEPLSLNSVDNKEASLEHVVTNENQQAKISKIDDQDTSIPEKPATTKSRKKSDENEIVKDPVNPRRASKMMSQTSSSFSDEKKLKTQPQPASDMQKRTSKSKLAESKLKRTGSTISKTKTPVTKKA